MERKARVREAGDVAGREALDDAPISRVRSRGRSEAHDEAADGRVPHTGGFGRTSTDLEENRTTLVDAPELGGEGARIALVADDTVVAQHVMQVLAAAGHAMRLLPGGRSAHRALADDCDLVLVLECVATHEFLVEAERTEDVPRPPTIVLVHEVDRGTTSNEAESDVAVFALRSGDVELCARVAGAVARHRAEVRLVHVEKARGRLAREYEAVREKLELARSRFHELRNMLVVVELGAHALLHEEGAMGDVASIMTSIDDSARRMRKVFNELDEALGDESER